MQQLVLWGAIHGRSCRCQARCLCWLPFAGRDTDGRRRIADRPRRCGNGSGVRNLLRCSDGLAGRADCRVGGVLLSGGLPLCWRRRCPAPVLRLWSPVGLGVWQEARHLRAAAASRFCLDAQRHGLAVLADLGAGAQHCPQDRGKCQRDRHTTRRIATGQGWLLHHRQRQRRRTTQKVLVPRMLQTWRLGYESALRAKLQCQKMAWPGGHLVCGGAAEGAGGAREVDLQHRRHRQDLCRI